VISGLNHVTFSVSNLDQSIRFYADLLGLRLVARWDKGAYLVAGRDWVALNVDPNVRLGPLPEYSHTAFTVSEASFNGLVQRLQDAQVRSWQQNRSPGASFYLLDPDGHKLELHVSDLNRRLEAVMKNPPPELVVI
jgi:catechol 2,3-dioxygenase-like lactoylglutathione lyase family enzyme